MKRKLVSIFLIYVISVCFLTWLQSCGNLLSYDARVCEIEFYGQTYGLNGAEADTLTENVEFIVRVQPNQNCFVLPKFSLVPSCYATTKCADWQNGIIQSSFELSFDRMVILPNDTIPVNTNLFNVSTIANGIEVSKNDNDCKSIQYRIKFTADLLSKINFEQGIYTTSFKCTTNDNQVLSKQRNIVFKP